MRFVRVSHANRYLKLYIHIYIYNFRNPNFEIIYKMDDNVTKTHKSIRPIFTNR